MRRLLASASVAWLALAIACVEDDGARAPGARAANPQAVRLAGRETAASTSPAESLYFRGEIDSARALWRRELAGAARRADTAAMAGVLTWFAIADRKEGKLGPARATAQRALALREAAGLGSTGDVWRTHNVLGLVDWDEGRLGDAAERFERTSRLARAAGARRGEASAAANMGLVLFDLGELDRARESLATARDAAAAIGDARIEGNALTNLGKADVALGDPTSAMAALERARVRYAAVGYEAGVQNALGQLATAHAARGDFRRAFAAADSSLRMAREMKLDAEEADLLRVLAELHARAGDARRALTLQGQARTRFAAIGMPLEEGAAAREQARLRLELGDTAAARRYGGEALRLHRSMGALHEAMSDLALLAELAAASARATEARRLLAEVRATGARSGAPALRLDAAVTEARVADRLRDHAGTLATLRAVAAADLARATAEQAWEMEALRARAHARLGRADSAAAAGSRAVRALERARARMGSGELRGSFAARHADVYGELVLALLAMGRTDSAFAVAEAARGRALLEHLASVQQQGAARTGGAEAETERLRRRIDELLAKLGERERARTPERSASEAEAERGVTVALLRRLEQARDEYEAHLARGGSPAVDATLVGARTEGGPAVRAALRPGEAMLEYLVTGERVLLFVATPDTLFTVVLPVTGATLAGRVRLARELVARRAADVELRPVLAGLHALLVAPAYRDARVRGARRLLLAPHGPLAYLPFGALLDARTGRYLVERHALLVLPSASALVAVRSRPTLRPQDGARPVALAPAPGLLPASLGEARAFARGLRGGRALVGEAATEAALREALAAGGVVHVAAHAEMNARNPMFSRIELARGDRLEVHELLRLRVASPLVFLSGCETALGDAWSTGFVRGEDYATLAQALLYAGARSVIATLWRIDDAGAATFAARYYAHLRKRPPVEALAAAQRESLRDPASAAPYHWAAYTLSGDGEPSILGAKARWWSVQRLMTAFHQ